MKNNNHSQHIYDLCKEHMHAYVLAETKDGMKFDGIITGLDEEKVYFAVPKQTHQNLYVDSSMDQMHRQYKQGYSYYGPGYGSYGGYGGYGGYGPGYYNYPPRRFERLILPLAALTAITLLPWY